MTRPSPDIEESRWRSPSRIVRGLANSTLEPTSKPRRLPMMDEVFVSSRTRSIWQFQLALTVTVAIIFLLSISMTPMLFTGWSFSVGVAAVFMISVVAVAVRWDRMPPGIVLLLPLGDTFAVGLLSLETDLRLAYLWAFPIAWVALHFSFGWLITIWGVIAGFLLLVSVGNPLPNTLLRFAVVLLSLGFIGLMLFMTGRRTRAYKLLLRRQAERLRVSLERATHQERNTSEMLNGIDSGVVRIDADGNVTSVNQAYIEIFGLDVDDASAPGTSVEYSEPRGEPIVAEQTTLARVRRGESITDETVWIFDRHDEWRALSVSAQPLNSPDGQGMLLVVYDVSTLMKANLAHERVIAITSHELRNPATAVLGHADLALEDETLSAETRNRLETIVSATERILEMSSSVLKRAEAAFTGAPIFEPYDLRTVIAGTIDLFGATAEENSVTLTLHGPDEVPMAAGDPFRLRQVLDNLVSNAVKYCHPGGEVEVSIDVTDDIATVFIIDNGIGMSDDTLARLFEPYFRAESAKAHAPGTGLGMAISRDIIISHGGTLQVESVREEGTTVIITLPVVGVIES